MHLAQAVNSLCVDDEDYEKVQKIFKEYANLYRFKQRVESGERLNTAFWVKKEPRALVFRALSDVEKYPSDVCRREEHKLFEINI